MPPTEGRPTPQTKRKGYLSWDDYFLSVAVLSSRRSKDPISPAGACIVDRKNRIVGIGYKGFPRGCSDEVFPWQEQKEGGDVDWLHTKDPYVCDAVMNAILNKCSDNVDGCTIYVMDVPNSDNAKVIIQAGIKEVVILGDDIFTSENDTVADDQDLSVEIRAGKMLFSMAGVTIRFFSPSIPSVQLDFVSKMTAKELESLPGEQKNETRTIGDRNGKEQTNLEHAKRLLLEEADYDACKVPDNGRAKNSISWEDYFMAMAFLTAERSKDPNTQVGACIVDEDKRIIGLGYNGFPSGCSDDSLPWARSNSNQLENKYLFVCHAEVNAILNKGSANVKGATLYVALFPCEGCSKMIIQSGIKEVVYMRDAYHDTPGCKASRIMLKCAGVKLRQYMPTMQRLALNFLEK